MFSFRKRFPESSVCMCQMISAAGQRALRGRPEHLLPTADSGTSTSRWRSIGRLSVCFTAGILIFISYIDIWWNIQYYGAVIICLWMVFASSHTVGCTAGPWLSPTMCAIMGSQKLYWSYLILLQSRQILWGVSLKGTGTRDYNCLKVVWHDGSSWLGESPADIQKNFNCPFNFILN